MIVNSLFCYCDVHINITQNTRYFLEKHISAALPSLVMSDYAVEYDNHPTYHTRDKRKRGSPVRVYSNISGENLVLPAAEGYKYCSVCARYVAATNRHCGLCGRCTSRDGQRWVHCKLCETCVKPGTIRTCLDPVLFAHVDARCCFSSHECNTYTFNVVTISECACGF